MAVDWEQSINREFLKDVQLPPDGLYKSSDDCTLNEAPQGFDSVCGDHLQKFVCEGYLIVRQAFTNQNVEDGLESIKCLTSEQNEAFNKGCAETQKIKPDMSDGPGAPIMQFEKQGLHCRKGERGHLIRKLQNFHNYEDRLNVFGKNAQLMRLIRDLVDGDGSEIKFEIFQSTAFMKPAKIGREKPWHQDHAYFNVPIEQSHTGALSSVVGVWIALDEATIENGCMHVLPGWHKTKGPIIHFQRRDWQICDSDILPCLPVPMKPGDALLFSSLLPHGTPPNLSDKYRRSIQYHFIPKGLKRIPASERLKLFGSEEPLLLATVVYCPSYPGLFGIPREMLQEVVELAMHCTYATMIS